MSGTLPTHSMERNQVPNPSRRSTLHRLVWRGERVLDAALDEVRTWLGRSDPPIEIVAYRTYGDHDRLEVRGRILARRTRTPAEPGDSVFRNLRRALGAFLTREMPGVEVFVAHAGGLGVCLTDEEGYFRTEVDTDAASGWTHVTLTAERAEPVVAQVLVPLPTARFLVISDIDDTILPTGATRAVTLVRNTFLGNARTRTPFPGIAEFYADLVAGAGGGEGNPVFYVSSSPWNLYWFMINFMAGHGLPAGPVLLRDIGVDESTFLHGSHDDHKLAEIRRILDSYPDLPVVLAGDSGQRDPEIYATIAAEYAGRVSAIYLRAIGGSDRSSRLEALARAGRDAPVVMSSHTDDFARHARARGLIR